MNDHDILLAIQDLMDGVEWNADTLDAIGRLLTENGYPLRDLDGREIGLELETAL